MRNSIITNFEKKVFANKKPKLPNFRPGDTVRVNYRVQEGASKDKFRIQAFEGVVLRRKRGTVNGSFTVRKMSAGGVGVERVFPNCSPYIDSVEVVSGGVVRRSRLYYLRELSGKAARIRGRHFGSRSTDLLVEEEEPAPAPAPKAEAAPAAEAPAEEAKKEDAE